MSALNVVQPRGKYTPYCVSAESALTIGSETAKRKSPLVYEEKR